MRLFDDPWFIQVMLDYNMDVDMLALIQISSGVYDKIADQFQIRYASSAGTLTCCQHGIYGLWHFYHLNQLGACLRELSPMTAHLQHGKVIMRKEDGFAPSLQTMTCTTCNQNMESTFKYLFGLNPRDSAELERFHTKGIEVSLQTLSTMMARLQGEIVIRSQRDLAMWHDIFDKINDCMIDECAHQDDDLAGPALYHEFEFDIEKVREMLGNPLDDMGLRRCCNSDPVRVFHKKYGECTVSVQLEVQDGLVFRVKLLSTKCSKDIDSAGSCIPDQDIKEVGIRPKCEVVVIAPKAPKWLLLEQDTYYDTFDEDNTLAQYDLCWLNESCDLYLHVKQALQSGTPLPIFVSMAE